MKGREGKIRVGSTWWVLVAGEETNESLSTWLRAAAAAQHSTSRRTHRERESTFFPARAFFCAVFSRIKISVFFVFLPSL
jgi:hypothetical protein